jgi:cytochrome c oxidase cbb3-type subunit III
MDRSTTTTRAADRASGRSLICAGLAGVAAMGLAGLAVAQTPAIGAPEQPTPTAGPSSPSLPGAEGSLKGLPAMVGSSQQMLEVPVSTLFPGAVSNRPDIRNPAGDEASLQRGMKFFSSFNCVGCHAANGGGGMGPSLSDWRYIYGEEPANIYLTIKQGRPNGMPSWGMALPDEAIWDLVTYVRSLREPKPKTFGETTSRTPPSPAIEQVPAEYRSGPDPWGSTEGFSSGQKPNAR